MSEKINSVIINKITEKINHIKSYLSYPQLTNERVQKRLETLENVLEWVSYTMEEITVKDNPNPETPGARCQYCVHYRWSLYSDVCYICIWNPPFEREDFFKPL